MVHAGCVFVAGIHLSRTLMSGSFESVRWNAGVHRWDLSLYPHLKEFCRNGVKTHVYSKGEILYTRKKSPEKRIKLTALHQAGQWAQHTTRELFWSSELNSKLLFCFSTVFCSLFPLSFCLTSPLTCIFAITLSNQYHYLKVEYDCVQ